jgi:hypothetical protein
MANNELIIPPDITPESPSRIDPVDDQTVLFAPRFARGATQRNSYGDPRWRFVHRYRGLRQRDQARMHFVVSEAQGAYRTVMVSPGQANRGSMATTYSSELFTNADLSSVSGWTGSNLTLSAADGVLRATVAGTGTRVAYQNVTVAQYAPYALRVLDRDGRGTSGLSIGPYFDDGVSSTFDVTTTRGYHVASRVSLNSGSRVAAVTFFSSTTGYGQNDFLDLHFASMARCFLVDGGDNLLLRSDEFDNASWAKSQCSATNFYTAPDGTATADALVESNSSNVEHILQQTVIVGSGAADYTFSVAVRPDVRGWAAVLILEGTAGSYAYAFINLNTGALGTVSTSGANWSNVRATVTTLGGSWTKVDLTARKTNAATSVRCDIYSATADASFAYAGSAATQAIGVWRATLRAGSIAQRLVQTTSAAVTGAQSGSGIHVKGLPVSQSGLLVAGDWVEIDGQLKRVTVSLDSDAAGLGYLQFRPKLHRAVADNTPVIVTKPVGRFLITGAPADMMFGLNSDYELTLDEVYE